MGIDGTPLSRSPLPTPISVSKLMSYLHGYDSKLANFLAQGFAQGFRICYEGVREHRSAYNLKSAHDNPDVVAAKLACEVHAGRIAGPFPARPLHNLMCSPIGLHPKKDGKFRLIHHLSWPAGESINDGIPMKLTSVKYDNVALVIQAIKRQGQPCFLAKTDIK
jgi:hypothetical protein